MMIWCVEDDSAIREIEVYTLQQTGYEARGFADSEEFWQALQQQQPDLVILDVMLPGQDGVEILKALRADPKTQTLPVIMATAKGMEYDKIQSLDLGADDYLVKPFGMMEMVSRIKAVLRRCQAPAAPQVLKAGELEVHLDAHTVFLKGERIFLTCKAYDLLKLFLEHPGRVFTRDQLFQQIWGNEYVGESRTVDMHVRILRQKLGREGQRIETVRGVGYRWEEQP